MKPCHITVVGPSSPAGEELLTIMKERTFPYQSLQLLESSEFVGQEIEMHGQIIPVQILREDSFQEESLVFFCGDQLTTRLFLPIAQKQARFIIDGSLPPVDARERLLGPLPPAQAIVPEVNGHELELPHCQLIRNPSPVSIQLALLLAPLCHLGSLSRVVVTAYRAVSDFGQSGIDELSQQVRALFNQEEFDKTLFPHQIAFSCLPYHSGILDSGHDLEEQRIMEETRSILDLPELRLSLTSVIAPIFCGNSLAVHIETTQKLEIDKVREIFNNAPSLLLEDVPAQHAYPVSFATIGKDEVSVGRIRPDPACENGLILWSAVDNIRKGNALNMIQIAETLLQHQR